MSRRRYRSLRLHRGRGEVPITVREVLEQENPHALLYPERYDAALVGFTVGFGTKCDTRPVAVYDHDKLVEILAAEFAEDDHLDGEDRDDEERYDDAEEWVSYNMASASLGANAPVIAFMDTRCK